MGASADQTILDASAPAQPDAGAHTEAAILLEGRRISLGFGGVKALTDVSFTGSIIVGVLENVAEFVDGQILHWGNLYTIAPFYVLVIIPTIKPYGLFGTRDIERL